MADYILPNWLTSALKRPSIRTQMESSMVGLLIMIFGSLGITFYLIANQIITGFWFIFLIVSSELGILSFQFSMLSQIYQQYNQFKLANNLYPEDYKLKMKIEEAKLILDDLNASINQIKSTQEVKQC